LVGGDPGIGKSTLLLQVLESLARKGLKVLYITGEESARQIKLRGKRVGASSRDLLVMVEIALENILKQIKATSPETVVIDSIQTIYSSALSSAPGSVGQVREAAERLIVEAKKSGIPIFLIGHVTKDGSIAGPKVLEHMVDTVLYLEGDRHHCFRILRGVKNRFGSTNEIGIFEMRNHGLTEVTNPAAVFLTRRSRQDVPGSAITAGLEGTRPMLVEIQALVSPAAYGVPRRMTAGVEHNRVALIVAVLEKRVGLNFAQHDIYVNAVGGAKVDEPAADLAIALALASSLKDVAVDARLVCAGEIGLTGELRPVTGAEKRVNEAFKLGFTQFMLSGQSPAAVLNKTGVSAADTLAGALELALML
ncbi:MAG: DNA repair protein radA, partial [Pelotomaculum thermopropionicum]